MIVAAELSDADNQQVQNSLDELQALLTTLHIETLARIVQKRQRFVSKSLVGEGKLEEIKGAVTQHTADMVAFDRELSPGQVRNLEAFLGVRVYDRTNIILEIFHENAKSNLARTQVEIARLTYLLPRLTGAWTHFQRQKGGGVNSKGMGETQIEIDRRRARERIHRLTKELAQIRQEKQTQSKSRRRELKVALVGYTNSGKTSLMNALTRSDFRAKDELFATLDASVRVIDPRTRPKILLSDTVGFIRNLPHSLVESFKSTLDQVLDADLLLHVVDVSAAQVHEHIATTESVLREIGADRIPSIIVFNKSDRLEDPFFAKIVKQRYRQSLVVSAHDEATVSILRDKIYSYFERSMQRVWLRIPHDARESLALVHGQCMVLETDYSDQEYISFFVQTTKENIAKLSLFVNQEPATAIDIEDHKNHAQQAISKHTT